MKPGCSYCNGDYKSCFKCVNKRFDSDTIIMMIRIALLVAMILILCVGMLWITI